MDAAGSLFTSLTLASIITTGGLTINLTENFGNLANDGKVKQEVDGDKLVGSYGNAVTGMSAVVIGLSALYLIFFVYGWYKKRGDKEARMQRVYWVVMLLAVLLGVASAAVNLNLTENYLSIDDLEPSPNPIVTGENYKLRGSYGTATLGMAAASLGMGGIAFLWLHGLWFWHWNTMGKYSTGKGGLSGLRKELDFSTL
jgi:multisubunit Na+/H+ antiporter MnhB subunit